MPLDNVSYDAAGGRCFTTRRAPTTSASKPTTADSPPARSPATSEPDGFLPAIFLRLWKNSLRLGTRTSKPLDVFSVGSRLSEVSRLLEASLRQGAETVDEFPVLIAHRLDDAHRDGAQCFAGTLDRGSPFRLQRGLDYAQRVVDRVAGRVDDVQRGEAVGDRVEAATSPETEIRRSSPSSSSGEIHE